MNTNAHLSPTLEHNATRALDTELAVDQGRSSNAACPVQ
jgi:hypothetical protein